MFSSAAGGAYCLEVGSLEGGGRPYINPAFSRGGDKVKSGCITPAVLGPTSGQNGTIIPANLGVPNVGTIPEVATYPLLSWGPTYGLSGDITVVVLRPTRVQNGNVTLAVLLSWGPPCGDKITSGSRTLAMLGPTSGQNGYITPTFSGSPQRGTSIMAAELATTGLYCLLGNSYITLAVQVPIVGNLQPQGGNCCCCKQVFFFPL